MTNALVNRPPVREWIPVCSIVEPCRFRVELIQRDSSQLGLVYFLMRVSMLDPPKWCAKTQFDIFVPNTLKAGRCKEGSIIKLKSVTPADSRMYIVHEIVEERP